MADSIIALNERIAELESRTVTPEIRNILKDHQIRELVTELRDIAVDFHSSGSLREKIARTVRAAMLADAPISYSGKKSCSELESRTVTVKSLTPEVCNALKAEGLADVLKDAAEYAPLTAGQWEILTKNWHQTFIGLSGAAAGIQVIEGEG